MLYLMFLIPLFALIIQIIDIIREFKNKANHQTFPTNRQKRRIKKTSNPISPKKEKIKRSTLIFITAKIVVAIGLFYLTWQEYKDLRNKENIASKYGELDTKISAISYPSVDFGTAISKNNLGQDFAYSKQNSTGIQVKKIDNKLEAKINIRDAFGNILAAIDGSTWKIYDITGIDYNNDDTGYEIVTGDQQVIFQMYLKDSVVICNGLLCSENGVCSYGNRQGFQSMIDKKGGQRFPIPEGVQTPLLFKYPREKYLGQRNKDFIY